MTDPETEFIRQLGVFGEEAKAVTRFFYTWRTVHAVLSDDESILDVLNENSSFWRTILRALLTASLVTLGRVFDQDQNHSTHNVDRLLRTAQTNLGIFSKEALAKRKRRENGDAGDWLVNYLQHVYVPTDRDFRKLRRYVADQRRIYEARYRPLRHRVFAHKGVLDQAEMTALFAKTKNRELQQLIVFLNRLHDALWHLLYNGRKPNLRPARYAVRRIREQPAPLFSHNTIQEMTIHETECFLKSLTRQKH